MSLYASQLGSNFFNLQLIISLKIISLKMMKSAI